MIDKLKSIKEFAEQDYMSGYPERTYRETYNRLINYINLLNKTLELGMFVPCLDGVPLEKPGDYEYYLEIEDNKLENPNEIGWSLEDCNLGIPKQCKQYQEAEKNVLFKGFYIEDSFLKMDGNFIPYQTSYDINGLQEEFQDLIELTEAFKQLITK